MSINIHKYKYIYVIINTFKYINISRLQTSVKLFHIVFCLNAVASHSIVKCFHDLSKRLGIALRHEEYRCL